MTTLFFDCFSGIAGDMTVSALHDLGVPESVFTEAVAAIDPHIACSFSRRSKLGIEGYHFEVAAAEHEHIEEPQPPHHHPAHVHRHWRDIRALIESSALDEPVKNRVLAVFERIARAEAKIHGKSIEEVAFHEVGAADSIADIVAACAGICYLAPERIICSSLTEGTGFVKCAHGAIPLPAPATLAILAGIPLRQVAEEHEFITPTGAAILAEFCEGFGSMPEMTIEKIGYGIGTRNTPPRPNALRLVYGTTSEQSVFCPPQVPPRPNALRLVLGLADGRSCTDVAPQAAPQVTILETHLDDITPELLAAAAEKVLAAGALDVFTTPILMKKGRPGFLLTVLARPEAAHSLAQLIFRETTTFGIRIRQESRIELERFSREVSTPHGSVSVKFGTLDGETLQATPEFESCRTLAEKTGVPLRKIYCAAL